MFSDTIANFLSSHVGGTAYTVLAFALLVLPPPLLVAVWVIGGRHSVAKSIAVGLGLAAWASLCDLCVPYLGLYPNLPGVVLAGTFTGPGADDTVVGQVCIHATNFLLWPLLGWLAGRPRGRAAVRQ